MPEAGSNSSWAHQLLAKLLQLPSTNSNLLSTCEEDLAGEADEPPDELNIQHCRPGYHSDGEFTKRVVMKPASHSSLLTQALTSPELAPVDRGHFGGDVRHGFSGMSIWSLSGASTAELTSDGGLSSRSHSPSPPHPPMLPFLGSFFHDRKTQLAEKKPVEITGDSDVLEGLCRRRAIKFACNVNPSPPRAERPQFTENKAVPSQAETQPMAPKRCSTIKFVCSQREDKHIDSKLETQPRCPPKIKFASKLSGRDDDKIQRSSECTAANSTPRAIRPTHSSTSAQRIIPNPSPYNPATRFYEFASSVEETESWMQHPPHGSRMLRVDGVLEKEKGIRKLSEEAEKEAKAEEGEFEEDEEGEVEVDLDEEEDEDELDEDEDEGEFDTGDYDDLEEDDEGEADNLSGNESDNEEGFASDDEDDEDDLFFHFAHVSVPSPMLPRRPMCCRALSESSVESRISSKNGGHRFSKSDLPDCTDFVCGTLDEDKAAEDAYVSALEEKKRTKRRITPQDIDPSFPLSDAEEDSDALDSVGSYHWVRGRTSSSDENCNGRKRNKHGILNRSPHAGEIKIRFRSPAGPLRARSPVPKRRMVSPPPPMSRRGSKHTTPPMSRRNSNEPSNRPQIGRRCMSPPPPLPTRNNHNLTFSPRPNVERTKSLPRNIHASNRGHSANEISTGHSPRGVPIAAGCSRKHPRRDGCAKPRPCSWARRGEGVEKMRELGLMLGKGKPVMPWLSSV